MKDRCQECGQSIQGKEDFSCPHCNKGIDSSHMGDMCWNQDHCHHKTKLITLTAVFIFIILAVIMVMKAKSYMMCGSGWGGSGNQNQLIYPMMRQY